MGVRDADRVAIVLRTEPAFLDAFFGARPAGAVPVPALSSGAPRRMDEDGAATGRMIEYSGARLVVSGGGTRRAVGAAVERARLLLGRRDASELSGVPARTPRDVAPEEPRARAVLFGSTVDLKPVALTRTRRSPHRPTR